MIEIVGQEIQNRWTMFGFHVTVRAFKGTWPIGDRAARVVRRSRRARRACGCDKTRKRARWRALLRFGRDERRRGDS